jgi:hypothetical protein
MTDNEAAKTFYSISIEDGAGYTKSTAILGTYAEARELGRRMARPGQTVEITGK